MKLKPDKDWLINQSPQFTSPVYLGNFQALDMLVRLFVNDVLECEQSQNIKKKIVGLSDALLGMSKHYPGPKWNSPGQIDRYLATKLNITEKDPKKIVIISIIKLLHAVKVSNDQKSANDIINIYVNAFMGM